MRGDSLHREWMNRGNIQVKKIPPYAIVHMAKGVQTMRQHIRAQTMPHPIMGQLFRCMDIFLMDSEMLTLETYVFAREHMNLTRVSLRYYLILIGFTNYILLRMKKKGC